MVIFAAGARDSAVATEFRHKPRNSATALSSRQRNRTRQILDAGARDSATAKEFRQKPRGSATAPLSVPTQNRQLGEEPTLTPENQHPLQAQKDERAVKSGLSYRYRGLVQQSVERRDTKP